MFRPDENEKPAFSNSSGLKNVFEDLRFRERLVWTEERQRFEISPAQCESRLLNQSSCFFVFKSRWSGDGRSVSSEWRTVDNEETKNVL